MTETTNTPAGLFTERERAILRDAEASIDERNTIRETVAQRFRAVLADMSLAYLTLRDEDIHTVFRSDSEITTTDVRSATQDALGLFVMGMIATDDLLEIRISDAIREAALAVEEEAKVHLDIRRGPRPTPEQCLHDMQTTGVTLNNIDLFEYYEWDQTIPSEQVARVGQEFNEDITQDEIERLRDEVSHFCRPPQTSVLDVTAATVQDRPHNSETEFQ